MGEDVFKLASYDYQIPANLIAQEPVYPRDTCRLLILDRRTKTLREGIFKDIVDFFKAGDVLVLNDTRVIKAALNGRKTSGGKIEVLLLKEKQRGTWEALVKPGRRVKLGDKLIFEGADLNADVIGRTQQASRILKFNRPGLEQYLKVVGQIPLPPYIKKTTENSEDYQTVYSRQKGSVAAPTAGLHFTPGLLRKIQARGVEVVYITLHCGLATFRPIKTEDIRLHPMDSERVEISSSAAAAVNQAKTAGRRVVGVGTTVARALEASTVGKKSREGRVKPFSGETDFYILPGYRFKIIDALITNFHTPGSTNLVLVSAFGGLGPVQKSYTYARARQFRFFSFGDAMLIG